MEFPVPRKHLPNEAHTNGSSRRRNRKPVRNGANNSLNGNVGIDLMQALLEELDEGVANVSVKGDILYANSRFAEMLGASRNGPVVGSLKQFVSPASWSELEAALARGVQRRTEGKMNVAMSSGPPRTIRLSLAPVSYKRGATVKITASEVTELVEKDKALQDTEASLHSLSARILQLQDQERRRIARDLHDITGQELAVVVMSLNQLAKKIDEPGVNVHQSIVDAVGLVRKVEDEIRTLSYVLHPPLLDDFGLASALNWYVEGFTKRSGIEVDVKSPPDLPRLSTEKETALFRVVQESLTNVLRHSGSRKARIRVSFDKTRITLSLEDEGQGIDRAKLSKTNGSSIDTGVGIAGMRERLQQLGGGLTIHSRARGTEVVASLPIVEGESVASAAEAAVSQAIAETHGETVEPATSETCKKRVLIADDHEVTRHGIKALLKDEPDIEICAEAQDGFEAVVKAREVNPDLIIMDLTLPRVGGFSAATSIRHFGLLAKILFFTTHNYPQFERMSRIAGFEGFVQKTDGARDLVRAIRAVLSGNKFYHSEVIQEHPAPAAR